jgi:plasmid stability protein
MGDLLIRALDDALIEGLKARAVERKQPLEQMLRDILAGVISAGQVEEGSATGGGQKRSVHDLVAMADQIAAMGPSRIDVDVPAMIRADREMR